MILDVYIDLQCSLKECKITVAGFKQNAVLHIIFFFPVEQ